VLANFGTKINRRKRAVRFDPNVVKDISLKRGDKRNGVIIKISDMGKEPEEVLFYKFFQWNPKLFTAVVNDLVLVRVTVNGVSAGGGGKEVRVEVG